MAEKPAFIKYSRKDPSYRPVYERLRDYNAVELTLTFEEILIQAERCMECGTPFCHAYGCPLGNIVPEFNNAARMANWKKALALLLSTNNFPEFTGRICPAPCEASCVAGINSDPVNIRHIELAIIEKGFENDYINAESPPVGLKERVAVVGSGPAGLAAADMLNGFGYRVTVYEKDKNPGGLLRYGVPDFKLEKWVVERRIELMKKQGIIFETGVKVGEDISYGYLSGRFDAVCLACGPGEPRDLSVQGRSLKGIYFAMDYLVQQNRRISGEKADPSKEITASGKTVVVIGGGDTGSDCLGTALRQGAGKVYQFEIMPEPPTERPDYTPWPKWPAIMRETHAHKEGGERRWSVMTKEFLGENGILKGLRCAEVEWKTIEQGRAPVPVEKPGTEFYVKADLVILAMGFVGQKETGMVEVFGVERDIKGNIQADECNMTKVKGLFVAGDMNTGQSLVVSAIADGRMAAKGIMAYLAKRAGKR